MKTDEEDIGTVPCCCACGSERVARDAWACFNSDSGLWELEHVFDDAHCHHCEDRTQIAWSRAEHPPHKRIRELNDIFRTQSRGNGMVLITCGVQAEGQEFVAAAVEAVRAFNTFSEENDPWGEHDFGAVELDTQKVFFKFDYFADDSLSVASQNPANEGMTYRVLTVMLASEY